MACMTDKTPTPSPAAMAALRAVPTFGEWFRATNPPATFAVVVLAQTAGAYFGMALVRAFLDEYPFPSFLEFLPLLGFLIVLQAVETYWRYRRLIKVRREEGVVYGQTAEGGAARAATSGGDSSYAPMVIPGMTYDDYPSHGGHSSKGHSDGGHSSHGGYDGGGYSGGSDGGGSGGGGE